MKVKLMTNQELINQLQKHDPNTEICFIFNGVMNSGDFLNISEVTQDQFILFKDEKIELASEYKELNSDYINVKKDIIILYCNRDIYYPFERDNYEN